jgi:hypothetical protein
MSVAVVVVACGAIPSPPFPGCDSFAAGAAWEGSAPWTPTLWAGVPQGDGGTSHALKAMGEGGHDGATGPHMVWGPGAQPMVSGRGGSGEKPTAGAAGGNR